MEVQEPVAQLMIYRKRRLRLPKNALFSLVLRFLRFFAANSAAASKPISSRFKQF